MKACLKTPRASKCAHVMGFCHGTAESLSLKKNTHKKKIEKKQKKTPNQIKREFTEP